MESLRKFLCIAALLFAMFCLVQAASYIGMGWAWATAGGCLIALVAVFWQDTEPPREIVKFVNQPCPYAHLRTSSGLEAPLGSYESERYYREWARRYAEDRAPFATMPMTRK